MSPIWIAFLICFSTTILTHGGQAFGEPSSYKYKTNTFDVPLDHFNFVNNITFKIRYLINDSFVKSDDSPIFFYTGNEGDIELFAQNTGFMWEAAEKLNALVIFAEHRYYGQSLPFGNKSYESPQYLGYLSSEQALADFADLIREVNKLNRPLIVFGGSYGGMLSAWMRMKYPHLVSGAIAASAPIFQFENLTPCDAFNRILTSVFKTEYQEGCAENIKKSWPLIKSMMTTAEGRVNLHTTFNLCQNLTENDFDKFKEYLTNVYANLAMVNYPYNSSFLAPLPAYPVRQFCMDFSAKLNDSLVIPALAKSLQVYTNFTQKTKCLNIDTASSSDLGDKGWDFQACTEMVMPTCSSGVTDMFWEEKWDFNKYSDDCFKKFAVRPRERAAVTYYGDKSLSTASNIVFSNGLLDPWSGGGVFRSDNRRIQIVIIPDGAHHIDLRGSNDKDPESVRTARQYHLHAIDEWIKEHWSRNNKAKK